MGFDPLNSGDYHRFESTTGSGSGGRKQNDNGSVWCWQAVLGWVIIIVAVVVVVCGTIAHMP